MSRPWMPLYVADYLADTGHLSATEHGAYLLLIMHYWSNGSLPTDDVKLARIARLPANEWQEYRDAIAAFFTADWRHTRIDAELDKFEVKRQARVAAGSRGGTAAAKNRKQVQQTNSNAGSKNAANEYQPEPEPEPSLFLSSAISLEGEEPQREQASGHDRWSFDEFWKLYPHKVGKHDARRAFDRVKKTRTVRFTEVVAGLLRYAAKTDDRPWCNPATWLNQGRWTDQPAELNPRPPPQTKNGFAVVNRDLMENAHAGETSDYRAENGSANAPAESAVT